MDEFSNKQVVVIGLDASGVAACTLLKQKGARVSALAASAEAASQKGTAELRAMGINLVSEKNLKGMEFAVHSSQTSPRDRAVEATRLAGVPIISDLELAARGLCCLTIGISGTNGKTTTA